MILVLELTNHTNCVTRSEIGLSRVAEARNRSVRIKNLPPATQEGLLQQVLEKIAPVKRVEVFLDKQEAVVELENPAVSALFVLIFALGFSCLCCIRMLVGCC